MTRVRGTVVERHHAPTTHDERVRQQEGQQQQRRGGPVLSRLAESFFWIGRYLERAEATARALSEHHHLLVEDRTVPRGGGHGGAARRAVAAAPGRRGRRGAGRRARGDVRTRPARSWARSRPPARTRGPCGTPSPATCSRRSTPPTSRLARGVALTASPSVAMSRVLERLLVVNGVIEWTMSRDEAHLFLSLGRSLERVDMTARLLDVRHEQLWPDSGPVATLRSAAALAPFLRTGSGRCRARRCGPSWCSTRRSPGRSVTALQRRSRRCAGWSASARRTAAPCCGRSACSARCWSSPVSSLPPTTSTSSPHAAQLGAVAASDAVAAGFFRQVGTIVWSH